MGVPYPGSLLCVISFPHCPVSPSFLLCCPVLVPAYSHLLSLSLCLLLTLPVTFPVFPVMVTAYCCLSLSLILRRTPPPALFLAVSLCSSAIWVL